MKVILTQEVKGKGGEGDVVDVAHGYAVNYLFPRKMAIEATSGNLKQLELRMHNIQQREEARISDASGLAGALDGKTVVITAKVGEEGRLYGSITAQMIEEAIAEQLDVVVDRRKMDMQGQIKATGDHVVSVQVYRDVKADVTVRVTGEGQEAEAAAPAVAAEEVVSDEAADEVVDAEAEAVEAEDADVDDDEVDIVEEA